MKNCLAETELLVNKSPQQPFEFQEIIPMNTNNQTMVWDLFIRVFHWLLVVFFFLAYATGDEKGCLHRYIGYLIILIVIARIYWGFFGTRYALFKNFLYSPLQAATYLKELITGNPTHYTGHNPAASWMILALLASSLIVCVSGYLAYATKGEHISFDPGKVFSMAGIAYADHDEKKSHGNKHQRRGRHEGKDSSWKELHETSANILLSLVFLHIIGVFISSRMHNENLVKSMITGNKAEKSARKT